LIFLLAKTEDSSGDVSFVRLVDITNFNRCQKVIATQRNL
jgi:hypothetical protein